ncbi:MAG TPA: CpsD/CapB family tyrosine-protein kinase, partial [Tepidisphaeraceae bacterium]|nr:CpsD/CapB family tyrosine-protein kinase [Tepidisphaeraceae bacterium]
QRVGGQSELSPRDVLLKLGQAEEAYAQPSFGALAPANLEVSRPALAPRMLDACQAVLERLVFARVAAGKIDMPRSIAVVSVTAGEGTTTLATHLAAAMTEFIHPAGDSNLVDRVLLVDANVASPGAHKVLDTSAAPGVAEWLTEPSMNGRPLGDFVKPTTVPNLDLLPAGLASAGHQIGRWTDAVTLATTSSYHSIIIDLPSMDRSEASARMAGLCDAAILVVECNTANREVVRQAAQRLEECGVMLLGTVLNKRTFPIPEQLYKWF